MSRRLKYSFVFCFALVLFLCVLVTASGANSEVLFKFDKWLDEEGANGSFSEYYTFTVPTKCDLVFTMKNASDSSYKLWDIDIDYDYAEDGYDYLYEMDIGIGDVVTRTEKDVKPGVYYFSINVRSSSYADNCHIIGSLTAKNQKTYLTSKSLQLGLGQKKTIKAYAPRGIKVTKWSSSNKKVAKVDKNGKITAKKFGNAKITAKLSNGKKLTCKVTVQPKISATKATLACGEKLKLKITKAGKNPQIQWTSSNQAVAQVAPDGTVTAGNKAGKAKITAKIGKGSASCTVTVKPPVTVTVDRIRETSIYNDLYVNFHNYSKKKVVYVKLKIEQYDNAGNHLRSPYNEYYLNETIKPGKSLKDWKYWVNDDTKKVSIRVTEVTFSDGSKWRP